MSNEGTERPRPKRRGRWWVFLFVNLLGLLLIVPLLKVTLPLVGIWWRTRSQDSLRAYEQTADARPAAGRSGTNPVSAPSIPPADPTAALRSLTNQAGILEKVSDSDLAEIISKHFGGAPRTSTNPGGFDMASAVFDGISKTTIVHNGRTYFGYQIDLVDQNGRHKTNIDCYLEPNLEYERSLATMDLINSSPQLKRIYRAMASSLADKTAGSNESESAAPAQPVLRLEPGSAQP